MNPINLSRKIQVNQKNLRSYEPKIAPKVKPNSFAHPNDDAIKFTDDGIQDLYVLFTEISTGLENSKSNTNVILNAAPQALSGAGAISTDSFATNWTTTGVNAATLANTSIPNQLKKITLVVDGGDGTLTPVTFVNGSTITFDAVGDYVVLKWTGNVWALIENVGCTIA